MNFSIIKILFIDYEIDKLWHFQPSFISSLRLSRNLILYCFLFSQFIN